MRPGITKGRFVTPNELRQLLRAFASLSNATLGSSEAILGLGDRLPDSGPMQFEFLHSLADHSIQMLKILAGCYCWTRANCFKAGVINPAE